MKRASCLLIIACNLLCLSFDSAAATHYVSANSPTPAFPYTTWETAATNIQDGVDAAIVGELVLVTNGVYATGGRAVYGTMTNRVAVTNALTIQSVNGPDVTSIVGRQVPGTTNGDGAIRCVYLTDGAVMSGFTLTNGATRTSGDSAREQCGGGVFCTSVKATVTNCVLSGNSAKKGGGSYYGALNKCTLTGNSAEVGGGSCYSTINDCTLSSNSALSGGGAGNSTLHNCTLSGNSASWGGGSYDGMLYNCALSGNTASRSGGGSYLGTLKNCTLSGSTAFLDGGGTYKGTLYNCIVYYNHAPNGPNWTESTLNYCCTTPLPQSGAGNLTADPQMASISHLSVGSPCRGAGRSAYVSGVDIDGEPWLNPPSIGCDEYYSGSITGALSVAIAASYTNVALGFQVEFQNLISGQVSASRWEFEGGTVVSNRPYASHSWREAGDYAVVLRAYNDSNPSGVTATVVVHVVEQPVHHVSLNSVSPTAPYNTWATAATNIQDAVDSAQVIGAMVLVTNGVYETGGKAVYGLMTNRVAVTKALTVQSVNGPGVTTIVGRQVPGTFCGDSAIRCVYLAKGAILNGFTLTKGATHASGDTIQDQSGGGILCASVDAVAMNCVVLGNSAAYGGGGRCGTLNNCVFVGNWSSSGGGAYDAVLNNCTLIGNSGSYGGGMYSGTLNNCIVYYNSGSTGSNYVGGTLNYCCTAPLPSSGTSNITDAPLFVDLAGGNFRLQSGSSCINAGNNAYAPGTLDPDGNPRIVGGTVDMGAYESSVVPPIPPEFTSCRSLADGAQLQFSGEIGRVYELYGSTNLTDWVLLGTLTNLSGQLLYTDPTATNHPSRFYRAVQLP